jgi:hypothetical protein
MNASTAREIQPPLTERAGLDRRLFKMIVGNYDDSTSSWILGAKMQPTMQAVDQPVRRSLARSLAVLGTALLVLGILAGTVQSSSAAPLSDGPAGTVLAAPASPASLQAAIGKSLGLAVSSAGYSQQAELTGSGIGYGISVALSALGATALVGEPGRNLGIGVAYVFTLRDGTWSRTAELTASHGAKYEVFGKSVALSASGSTALVGEPGGTGAVYVFTLRHGTWSRTAKLTASHGVPGGNFGQTVALSATGSTALVGAPFGIADAGIVYVFTLRRGTWSQTAELTGSDAAPGSEFGYSLALSATGTTTLAGAPLSHSQAGSVYVFTLRHGTWSQTAELTASHGPQFDDFGQSVALSGPGGTAVAGAHNTIDIGAAYVFTLRRATWSQTAELTASDAAPGNAFGYSLALSATGGTVLAGAPYRSKDTGAVYVFTLRRGAWSQTAELTASDAAPGSQFGYSLALSATGGTALAGAPYRATGTGAAYVFTEHNAA